jgi:hypothetical protein
VEGQELGIPLLRNIKGSFKVEDGRGCKKPHSRWISCFKIRVFVWNMGFNCVFHGLNQNIAYGGILWEHLQPRSWEDF